MEVIQDKLQILRSRLDQIPVLQKAEKTLKVPKEYLVIGGGAVFTILVFFGVGAGVLCSIVGFLYPAFKSFEAIESKQKGDDIQWLIYWVVFAFFSVIETFIDFLLYWIPFYYAFKLAFLLWAMLPQTKGAKFLYDSFLKDFLKKNESRIDAAMADAKKSADTIAQELAGESADLAKAAKAQLNKDKDESVESKKDE